MSAALILLYPMLLLQLYCFVVDFYGCCTYFVFILWLPWFVGSGFSFAGSELICSVSIFDFLGTGFSFAAIILFFDPLFE
jgi:hypothetical protein